MRTAKSGTSDIVSFPVHFSKNRVNIQLNLNENGEGDRTQSPVSPMIHCLKGGQASIQ